MCKMLPCFSCWIVSLREMNVSNVPKKGIFMSVVFLHRGSLCQSFFFFSFLCTTSPDEWSVRSCLNQENGILLHPQSWWVSHCTHPCRHSTAQIVEHLWDSSQAFHFNRCHRLFTFFLSLVYFFAQFKEQHTSVEFYVSSLWEYISKTKYRIFFPWCLFPMPEKMRRSRGEILRDFRGGKTECYSGLNLFNRAE